MRLYLVKTRGGDVIGWGANDAAYLAKLGDGECLECDTRKARNPNHHRLFFALLQQAFINQEQYRNLTDLLVALKLKIGHYSEHITADGKLVYVPKSISFARLDQNDFDVFYNQAVVALAEMFGTPEVVAEADGIIARQA